MEYQAGLSTGRSEVRLGEVRSQIQGGQRSEKENSWIFRQDAGAHGEGRWETKADGNLFAQSRTTELGVFGVGRTKLTLHK